MYAILKHGGHQYRVASGDRIVVDRLRAEVGAVIGLSPVLLVSDGDRIETDGAGLEGVRIAATVLAHPRGRKLRVFTYKPKKRHRRTLGFRAELTELLVGGVLSAGEPLPEPSETPVSAAEPGAPVTPEPTAVPAAPRPRRRRAAAAAAEAAEEETVAAAWGEAEPAPAAEATAAPPEASPEEAAQAPAGPEGTEGSETLPSPEAAGGEETPAPRRRPRAPAADARSGGEPSTTPAEEAPGTGARRRRVTRREEPGSDRVE